MDIFLFIAAILSMVAMAGFVHIMCKHSKLKALVTGIAFQPIKGTDAIFGSISNTENCTCKAQWYFIGALTLVIIDLIFFIYFNYKKMQNIQRTLVEVDFLWNRTVYSLKKSFHLLL